MFDVKFVGGPSDGKTLMVRDDTKNVHVEVPIGDGNKMGAYIYRIYRCRDSDGCVLGLGIPNGKSPVAELAAHGLALEH